MTLKLLGFLFTIIAVLSSTSCDNAVTRDEAEKIATKAFLSVAHEKGLDPSKFSAPTQRAATEVFIFDFDAVDKKHFISVTVRADGSYRMQYLDDTRTP